MNMQSPSPSPPLLILVTIILTQSLKNCYSSSLNSLIYVGCSQLKYSPGSPYESNLNSILTSIVSAASSANYNNFKVALPGSASGDVAYGLFQCRGDLASPDCRQCVSAAVARLGASCSLATGGALQLEGCFVRFDNDSFVGAEDKTVAADRCGPLVGDDSAELARRDSVLSYLGAGGQFFRVSEAGRVQGVAQCVQDLSVGECQDCLSDAVERLRTQCGSASWGDMFFAKCYARYSERGYTSKPATYGLRLKKTLRRCAYINTIRPAISFTSRVSPIQRIIQPTQKRFNFKLFNEKYRKYYL
ncbi:plasmodesmata-located protein 6-like isoform X1 [Salvia splendens]|uniref:plasmodesmata-located protein 6-like isoform X1 n=1 Tax=Salvia splendens TaxID=180675 RepID=UPI001C2714E6|nr:plasmodesmata-located protein 6-like isoform X1 [Salvia splendens]